MEAKHDQTERGEFPFAEALHGTIRRVWDAFEKRPYQVLHGTGTVLDGTVMATSNDARAFQEQVKESLLLINEERKRLGLAPMFLR